LVFLSMIKDPYLKIFLVVDDFSAMRQITTSQLRALGIKHILTAQNGVEALAILQKQHVDMVLSDWNMPIMDGLELLRSIRSNEKLHHIPFVMITGEKKRSMVAEAIALGTSDLLIKPYTAIQLAHRIDKAISWKPLPVLSLAVSTSKDALQEKTSTVSLQVVKGRQTILVVDDAVEILHLLSNLLKDEYQVLLANNGKKALTICTSENPPDIVLLDVVMHDMDGFEVARRMREHPGSENIPVIFITSLSDDASRQKGMNLGAVDFVSKPIDPLILKPRIRNFMRYVELHKGLQANCDVMLNAARLRDDVDQITRHDMKGPLASIIGLIQNLSENETLNHAQGEKLRLAEETALQLLSMINLSSELYKIESGRFELKAKPVDILHILRRLVELERSIFTEKELIVSVSADVNIDKNVPRALGDPMFCYSLLQNLIRNACEAAPNRTPVSISLKDGNPLQIFIRNSGVVPQAIRSRFFEKFVTSGKPDGTGLGTYSA